MPKHIHHAPRPTPYARGQMAARAGHSLKGLPYGPGARQDEFLAGYRDTRDELAHANARAAQPDLGRASGLTA